MHCISLQSNFSQTTPTAEELGFCDSVKVAEIGDTPVIVFQQGILW